MGSLPSGVSTHAPSVHPGTARGISLCALSQQLACIGSIARCPSEAVHKANGTGSRMANAIANATQESNRGTPNIPITSTLEQGASQADSGIGAKSRSALQPRRDARGDLIPLVRSELSGLPGQWRATLWTARRTYRSGSI